MWRAPSALGAALLLVGAYAPAGAQDGALRIRATRSDTIRAGVTATASFAVTNGRPDSVEALPHLQLPADWTVLMGSAALRIGPGGSEVLMVSVAVPARAPAGVYPVRVSVTTSTDVTAAPDSVLVLVPQRRALDATLLDRPGFTVSGTMYDVSFLVRNRGNVAAEVRLATRSSLGVAMLPTRSVRLAADEARVIRLSVRAPADLESARDDVIELDAIDAADSLVSAQVSARVTVVPEPDRTIEEYLKVPTQVRLRAGSSDAVSPFEVTGHGLVRDGSPAQLDFLFRGPTGPFSAFGERDEYSAQLTAPGWRARVGDQFFTASHLTGAAQPGFGLGADVTRGMFSFTGHGQQFRRDPKKGSELGASAGVRLTDRAHLSAQFVDRDAGELPGTVGSATASLDGALLRASAEIARSTGPSGAGSARTARLSGTWADVAYDAGHLHADTAFSGAAHGSSHNYVGASSHHLDGVSFALSGSNYRTDASRSTGVPYVERLDIGTASATLLERYTLELAMVARGATIAGAGHRSTQRGVRARAEQDWRFGTLSFEGEWGRAQEPDLSANDFTDFSFTSRRTLAPGAVALWGERYSGGSITKGLSGTTTIGGDASLRLSRTMDVRMLAYATRIRTADGEWHSQFDAMVSHRLPTGSTISLRTRVLGGGSFSSSREKSVAYLEYGVPLRVPVSRLRTTGRVVGRVVDATSQQGVPGALVRLGPQVAITDDRGRVAFGGVPGGEHRLSMSQETSFANAVFVGDPTLRVDSTRVQPTTFELAIATSARVAIGVRRLVVARRGVDGAADSLADGGVVSNATLVLAGDRDTLYRTTGENGAAFFTDVPPGRWSVSIRGDAPAFHRFDPDRVEFTLAPGESKALVFRLVPRRRDVQIIGAGQELNASSTETRKPPSPPGTRTVKPDRNQ